MEIGDFIMNKDQSIVGRIVSIEVERKLFKGIRRYIRMQIVMSNKQFLSPGNYLNTYADDWGGYE